MKATLKGLVIILILAVFVLSGCTSDSSSGGSTGSTGSTGDTGTTGSTGLPGSTGSTGDDGVDTGPIGTVEGSGDPSSIEFVSATPENIALKGAGGAGRPETSVIVFKVLDENGGYLAGVTVNFSFATNVGGLTMDPTSSVTNADGLAGTYVTAGNIPTSVRVIGTVDIGTEELTTMSSSLVVSTGVADQNSFSLSVSSFSPEGWNFDGETVTLTIMAADHFNNPVPDGTMVYFTTEGGAIDSYCLTSDGSCTVVWNSQNPRPVAMGDPTVVPPEDPRDGRVTIMAYAIGEESFVDVNGDGVYDSDDRDDWTASIFDLPEAHHDIDEDWIFDDGYEEFRDFNSNGTYDTANGIYNGTLCTDTAESTGVCTKDVLEVRESIDIVMSRTKRPETPYSEVITSLDGGSSVTLTLSDYNGNGLPAGTDVLVTACADSTIDAESGSLKIDDRTEPQNHNVVFTDGDHCASVKVTTPKGMIIKGSFSY